MRRLTNILVTLFIVIVTGAPLIAQDPGKVFCQACGEINSEKNNYCTSCGAKLVAMRSPEQETVSSTYYQHARLLSVPMATTLPESYLAFTFGNGFGIQVGESFLGTAIVGVGGIGEIELSTAGLVTNLVSTGRGFRTAGMKVQLFKDDGVLPAVGSAVRSSNDWEREERNDQIIATSDSRAYDFGLRSLNFESRITTLTFFMSKKMREQTTLHAGVGFSDIRYRSVSAGFTSGPYVYDPSERRTNQWQAFGGTSIAINNRTTVIGEVQTLPLLKYDVERRSIRLGRMYVGAAGIRFSLTPSWSIDSGIRYQDNFVGLADMQFRVSINGVFVLR